MMAKEDLYGGPYIDCSIDISQRLNKFNNDSDAPTWITRRLTEIHEAVRTAYDHLVMDKSDSIKTISYCTELCANLFAFWLWPDNPTNFLDNKMPGKYDWSSMYTLWIDLSKLMKELKIEYESTLAQKIGPQDTPRKEYYRALTCVNTCRYRLATVAVQCRASRDLQKFANRSIDARWLTYLRGTHDMSKSAWFQYACESHAMRFYTDGLDALLKYKDAPAYEMEVAKDKDYQDVLEKLLAGKLASEHPSDMDQLQGYLVALYKNPNTPKKCVYWPLLECAAKKTFLTNAEQEAMLTFTYAHQDLVPFYQRINEISVDPKRSHLTPSGHTAAVFDMDRLGIDCVLIRHQVQVVEDKYENMALDTFNKLVVPGLSPLQCEKLIMQFKTFGYTKCRLDAERPEKKMVLFERDRSNTSNGLRANVVTADDLPAPKDSDPNPSNPSRPCIDEWNQNIAATLESLATCVKMIGTQTQAVVNGSK